MGIDGVIALLQIVVANLPGAITTGEQLVTLGKKFFSTVNGQEPTDDEVTALESAIDAEVLDLLMPLPSAQPGDPDYQP